MSLLERRLAKLERSMMAGKYPKGKQDPEMVKFFAAFGVPVDRVPFGVAIKDDLPGLAKAVQGNSIGRAT